LPPKNINALVKYERCFKNRIIVKKQAFYLGVNNRAKVVCHIKGIEKVGVSLRAGLSAASPRPAVAGRACGLYAAIPHANSGQP
jgi:hypothetical protein